MAALFCNPESLNVHSDPSLRPEPLPFQQRLHQIAVGLEGMHVLLGVGKPAKNTTYLCSSYFNIGGTHVFILLSVNF